MEHNGKNMISQGQEQHQRFNYLSGINILLKSFTPSRYSIVRHPFLDELVVLNNFANVFSSAWITFTLWLT